MYMMGAFETFEELKQQQIAEIAKHGESGLSVNDPQKRYSLKSLDGYSTCLQLLSMMPVVLKAIDPFLDSQSGLDVEYGEVK